MQALGAIHIQVGPLGQATLAIPGIEAILLLVLLTLCLLLRRTRTGLLVAYGFVYRWGLLFGTQYLKGNARLYTLFLTGYIVFGILAVTLSVVAMMAADRAGQEE